MERSDILELMSALKLYGMRAAHDEVMATGLKRRHEPPRIVGDLLSAEIAEKKARSIKYQLTIAKLPLGSSARSTPSRSRGRSVAGVGGAFVNDAVMACGIRAWRSRSPSVRRCSRSHVRCIGAHHLPHVRGERVARRTQHNQ